MSESTEARLTAMANELAEANERLARIEGAVDSIVAFNSLVAETAAPFLSGRTPKWLALVAKSRGSGK